MIALKEVTYVVRQEAHIATLVVVCAELPAVPAALLPVDLGPRHPHHPSCVKYLALTMGHCVRTR
jgi:hypothetical protein